VPPGHAEEPVDAVLYQWVVRIQQAAGLVDQPLVIVVAQGHDPMADQVIEHDQREEPREVRRGVFELRWDHQRAREKRRPMRVR
jgi:hypothetical protein